MVAPALVLFLTIFLYFFSTMSRFVVSSLRVASQVSRIAAPQLARKAVTFGSRTFTSSLVRANTTKALLEVIKSEAKIAEAIENEVAPDHVQYLKATGFEVKQVPGESNVELSKTLKTGESLKIFFDIDEVTDMDFAPEIGEEEVAEGESQLYDEEMFQMDSTFANIKVFVSNPETNDGLFFNLMLQNSEEEFFVDYFNYKPDAAAFLSQVSEKGTFLGKFEYQGPRFSNLDESLQTSVEQYLKAKGVNADLADFIFGYSEYKEEDAYRTLLGNISNYLGKQ